MQPAPRVMFQPEVGGGQGQTPEKDLQQMFTPVGWYRYRCLQCDVVVKGYKEDLERHRGTCGTVVGGAQKKDQAANLRANKERLVPMRASPAPNNRPSHVDSRLREAAPCAKSSPRPVDGASRATSGEQRAGVRPESPACATTASASLHVPAQAAGSAPRGNLGSDEGVSKFCHPKKRRLQAWRAGLQHTRVATNTASNSPKAEPTRSKRGGRGRVGSDSDSTNVSVASGAAQNNTSAPVGSIASRRATNQDILEYFVVNMKTDRAHCVFCNKEVALDSYSAQRPRGGKAKRHLAACTRCPPDLRDMLDKQAVREFHATKNRRRGEVWKHFTVVGYRRFRCHACSREIKGDAQCLKGELLGVLKAAARVMW